MKNIQGLFQCQVATAVYRNHSVRESRAKAAHQTRVPSEVALWRVRSLELQCHQRRLCVSDVKATVGAETKEVIDRQSAEWPSEGPEERARWHPSWDLVGP